MHEKTLWQTIVEALEKCEKPHGYSLSELLEVLLTRFSVSVTEKTARKVLKQLLFSPVSLKVSIIRTGPKRTPTAFFSIKINPENSGKTNV